jgi:hypothetical protein
MRILRLMGLALVLVAVPMALSACGGDGDDKPELSRTTASQMRASLDGVESDVQAGNCIDAATQAAALETQAKDLPNQVDADLRSALIEGAGRLVTLVRERCDQTTVETTTIPTTPTETTPEEQDEEKPKKGKKDKKKDEGSDETDGTTDGGTTGPNGAPDTGGTTGPDQALPDEEQP